MKCVKVKDVKKMLCQEICGSSISCENTICFRVNDAINRLPIIDVPYNEDEVKVNVNNDE